jgi:IS1 family transposase
MWSRKSLTAHIERNDSTAQLFIARTARVTGARELTFHL